MGAMPSSLIPRPPLRARPTPLARVALFAALLAAGGGGGCSSFNQEWRAASALPAAPTDVTGRWQGTWDSDQSGHGGGLRCVVSRLDEQTFRAHFAATYAGALRFNYVARLTGQTAPDGYTYFEGSADLGALAGGVYEYEGRADAREFECVYRSKSDRGRFQMARPPADGAPKAGQGEGE